VRKSCAGWWTVLPKTWCKAACVSFPDDESVVDDMNGETFYEVYNTKYIIGDDGSFHDVMLMLAGGGPVIWLDTWSQEIRGSWGSDKYTKYIYDYDYVLDYWEEEYSCLS
jgi:hypothetical protein